MYKTTQDRHDHRGRVGSHATKGNPTKGVIEKTKHVLLTPTKVSVYLAEISDERAALAARKKQLETEPPSLARTSGITRCDARLSILNAALKVESQKLRDAEFATCLERAIVEKLPEHVASAVMERARDIHRIAIDILNKEPYSHGNPSTP